MWWMVVGLVLSAGFGLVWWAAFTGPTDGSDAMPADRRTRDQWRDYER